MTYPPYIREKARTLRVEKKLTIDEIAERLAVSRTTVFYWVGDIEIPRTSDQALAQQRAGRASRRMYRDRRETAYRDGAEAFELLSSEPTFRDFICLYMAEGYKRNRNSVAICNSDAAIMQVAFPWISRFARNKIRFSVLYHADQNLRELKLYWANQLGLDPEMIQTQRKSNSGGLKGRNFRSRYGVLTIAVGDTDFRSRLEAWMDCLRSQWLDSPGAGA